VSRKKEVGRWEDGKRKCELVRTIAFSFLINLEWRVENG